MKKYLDSFAFANSYFVLARGVSGFGSALTIFGLNVWVFRETGSFSIFVVVSILSLIPRLVFSPLAGVLGDRYSKRTLLIVCDYVSMAAIFFALTLDTLNILSVPFVAICIVALSLSNTLRWPVTGASISTLVPSEERHRANGILQAFQGISEIGGPLIGAAGIALLGLNALLIVDLITYLVSLHAIRAVDIPVNTNRTKQDLNFSSFLEEIGEAFVWVRTNKPLWRLLCFFLVFNLVASIYAVSFTPYILSFASSDVLGLCLAIDGLGLTVAGLLIAHRSVRVPEEKSILFGALLVTVCYSFWGVSRSAPSLIALAFLVGAASSLILSSSQTVWQQRVPIELQSRVFSLRQMIAFSLNPLALLFSIPLAEFVFSGLIEHNSFSQHLWGPGLTGMIGMMISFLGVIASICIALLIMNGGLLLEESALESGGSDHSVEVSRKV